MALGSLTNHITIHERRTNNVAETNQRYLTARLRRVRAAVESHIATRHTVRECCEQLGTMLYRVVVTPIRWMKHCTVCRRVGVGPAR